MITSTVKVHDGFGEINAAMDAKIVAGLNAAAHTAAQIAEEKAGNVSKFDVITAHGTANGFASGIRASSRLVNVFNKGSLGKRVAALKPPARRKDFWTVKRGENPYTAHRLDTTGKGVAARDIFNPARTAGRKILNAVVGR